MDNLTPQESPTVAPEGGEPKQGFLSTARGRLIVIVGAVVGFLVIAGIAAALVFTFFIKGLAEDAMQDIATGAGSQSTTSTSTAGAPVVIVEPSEIPVSDLFTFRDIFVPLITAAEEATSTSSEATSSTTFEGEPDTLYLLDVVVEDGTNKAVLSYNGEEHRLAAGEALSGTPWQVLSIGSRSVVMLYGDSQVSLSVGQGVIDTTTSTTATSTAK